MDNATITHLEESISRPQTQKNRRWLSLSALSAAFLVDQSENYALSVLWPQIYRTLSVSVGQLGPVLAISQVVSTLTMPVWGYAVDRFSRKWLLVWFTGIWGLWTCAIGLVDTLWQLMLVRALSALGLSVFLPASFSLIGDLFESQSRGRAIGTMRGVGVLGTFVAFGGLPLLAGRSPEAWRWGFVFLGIISLLSGLIMLRIQEPVRGAAEPELQGLIPDETVQRYTFKWRDVWTLAQIHSWRWLLLKDILDAMSLLVFYRWAFPWFDELGLGQSAILVMVLIFVGVISGYLIAGWLSDSLDKRDPRYGRLRLVLIGVCVQVPVTVLLFRSSGENLVWLVGVSLIFTLSTGVSSESVRWPLAHAILPPELRGSGQAFMVMAIGLSNALMLALSGLLADRMGVAAMLQWVIPIPIVVSIVTWLPLFRTYPLDREILHKQLSQRRAGLHNEPR